jgi:transcriptional regulator with XRE-family HTH domain
MKKTRGRKPKEKQIEHWGKRLASTLSERRLSSRAAAKLAGVSPTVLSSWVRVGASPTDLKSVKKLSDELGVDFAWLLTGEAASKNERPSISELFSETQYFDGYARIRIDRLIPIDEKKREK